MQRAAGRGLAATSTYASTLPCPHVSLSLLSLTQARSTCLRVHRVPNCARSRLSVCHRTQGTIIATHSRVYARTPSPNTTLHHHPTQYHVIIQHSHHTTQHHAILRATSRAARRQQGHATSSSSSPPPPPIPGCAVVLSKSTNGGLGSVSSSIAKASPAHCCIVKNFATT